MLSLMFVLACGLCFIEYRFTRNRPAVRMWLGQHKVVSLGGSVVLSFCIGALFDADGLIVMGAAILAMVMMQVLYTIQPALEANKRGIGYVGLTFSAIFKLIIAILFAPFKIAAWIAGGLEDLGGPRRAIAPGRR